VRLHVHLQRVLKASESRGSQPMMAHGNRHRDCWGSVSVCNGEGSFENSFLMSMASRLEYETVGEWELGDREVDECEKSKFNPFVYSCRLGCGGSDKPELSR
jgi:hypothetical protein